MPKHVDFARSSSLRHVRFNKGIGQILPNAIAPSTRGHRTNNITLNHHRSSAMCRCHRAIKCQSNKLFARPLSVLLHQGIFTNKTDLIHLHKTIQASFEWIEFCENISLPMQVPFFKAHGFNSQRTEELQPMCIASITQRKVGGIEGSIWNMNFIGQLP